jgi:hypothetical protein
LSKPALYLVVELNSALLAIDLINLNLDDSLNDTCLYLETDPNAMEAYSYAVNVTQVAEIVCTFAINNFTLVNPTIVQLFEAALYAVELTDGYLQEPGPNITTICEEYDFDIVTFEQFHINGTLVQGFVCLDGKIPVTTVKSGTTTATFVTWTTSTVDAIQTSPPVYSFNTGGVWSGSVGTGGFGTGVVGTGVVGTGVVGTGVIGTGVVGTGVVGTGVVGTGVVGTGVVGTGVVGTGVVGTGVVGTGVVGTGAVGTGVVGTGVVGTGVVGTGVVGTGVVGTGVVGTVVVGTGAVGTGVVGTGVVGTGVVGTGVVGTGVVGTGVVGTGVVGTGVVGTGVVGTGVVGTGVIGTGVVGTGGAGTGSITGSETSTTAITPIWGYGNFTRSSTVYVTPTGNTGTGDSWGISFPPPTSGNFPWTNRVPPRPNGSPYYPAFTTVTTTTVVGEYKDLY